MMMVGVLSCAVLDARAEDISSRCGSELLPSGRVAHVVDGRSFVLDDGREIRLASLEIPAPETSATGAGARTALAAMLTGKAVALRSAAPAPDRYGRTMAYAAVESDRGPRPVTHAMLAMGHARVGIGVGGAACAAELFSQERLARTAKIGLWGEPRYAIIAAGNLKGLVAGQGHFAVVEGTVSSVRESGGIIYVNFGRRWSQALTVTISKRHERIFRDAGLTPKAFENRRLRVRGWIEVRNGPRIEAGRPEQIELVAAN